MTEKDKTVLRRLVERVFPTMPDFFSLLSEQSVQVAHAVGLLIDFLKTGNPDIGRQIKADELEADRFKVRNIHILNESFATPIDREDIYRAIMDLDDVVNYCKTTVSEMDLLGVTPDGHIVDMAVRLEEGVAALVAGFAKLGTAPAAAGADADAARKAERRVEKIYRRALADLFQGNDYTNMFKRREIYRHLSNAADRMAHGANTLHDIVVKIS